MAKRLKTPCASILLIRRRVDFNLSGILVMATLRQLYRAEYRAWRWAIRWCTDPTLRAWPWYGGSGIKVCPQWVNSFEQFLKDVGPKPVRSRSIWLGRLDVLGNYEPGNVAWVPRQRQITHRRNCCRIPCNGQELSVAEAGRALKVSIKGLRKRIKLRGMEADEAIHASQHRYSRRTPLLTYQGETLSVMEWEKRLGLKNKTLQKRLAKGMPLEKAMQSADLRRRKASSP